MLQELEKAFVDATDDNINLLVPWYIMASYAYYVQDNPILSDRLFDRCAKKLLENWDDVKHIHKHYITVDMLKAGTYIGEYPSRVEGAVDSVRSAYSAKKSRRQR